jgi:hypothetical protein
MTIKECTEKRYDQMLGILPPQLWLAKGFLKTTPLGALHPALGEPGPVPIHRAWIGDRRLYRESQLRSKGRWLTWRV